MSLYEQPCVYTYIAWYIPQIPGKAFEYHTDDRNDAYRVLGCLTAFSAFEFQQRVKGDCSDAGGVAVWDDEDGCYVDLDEDAEVSA